MKFSLPSWTTSRGNGSEPDRVLDRLEALDAQLNELERRRVSLDARERDLDARAATLREGESTQHAELERVASLSAGEARQELLAEVEADARRQAGLALRKIEEETRREAEHRARGILATATQRLAGPYASRTTTQLVHLPNDEMKGRIIGRDGRNIHVLEQLTGVDIIVDDAPSAVRISSFDGMRREVARLTLERLIADGRIHPARCEEAFEQASREIEERIVEEGERATLDAKVNGLHPQLVDLLGKLQFRTSYGQNVLAHLVECSYLAGLIALELGGAADIARRAALLHDIGKATDQEAEGTHAQVGARLARRYGESEAVIHAIEAHHDEIEPQTVEAVIVQAADALSGARPGARGDTLEGYVTRLRDLEALANRHAGVEKVYAMQAGREMRVMVDPGEVDDERAALISHEIAAAIEREITYPGRIKITVIRESRATNYAR
ncbi:MAG TPA: ribonuclease Y [Solirubrobacterales bacterium]|nr:ribonuclease Y [Solirubrobacterales bacterium]